MKVTYRHLLLLIGLAGFGSYGSTLGGPGGLDAEFAATMEKAVKANPLLSQQPILYVVRHQYEKDHHNTATLFQTGEINTEKFRGPAALKTLDVTTGKTRTLLEVPEGVIRDPDVSFDGKRLLFSMRRDIDDDYHVYEMASDGSGLTQLTFGTGLSDVDPFYLADGDIAFSSTREPKYCMCNRHIMANLFRMGSDGADIHQIARSTLFEGHGSLLPDGRILYDRWEYVDRNFGDAQGLWTVNPDGTNPCIYWGNNTWSPGGVIDARAIPGTGQVICIFSSCHDRPWGALAVVDRRLGLDGKQPVVKIWPFGALNLMGQLNQAKPTPYGFDNFQQVEPKYEDPYPLTDRYFLVSRSTGKGALDKRGEGELEMGLYLVDVFGNETLLHVEGPGCYDPMPLGPRQRPATLPVRRDFENQEGRFYVVDVYQGSHMEGVHRGDVKYLRVVESPEKRSWTQPSWKGQGTMAPAMNWHDFNNKRILGTVPVEKDGSAYFSVPSDRFVYFQLLDEEGMLVQSMRSGTMVQSGEVQGCVGCHDERRSAPSTGVAAPVAMRRGPDPLKGWYGPPRLFSYVDEVQPVLDAFCVRCHDYGKEAGKVLNLSGDRALTFNTSYNELWRKSYTGAIGAGPHQTQQAYAWGSRTSRLIEVIQSGHQNVKLDQEAFARLVTWIDLNAPYYPVYESAHPGNLAGRSPLDDLQLARLSQLTGVAFAKLASASKNEGPQLNFGRPGLSACLQSLKAVSPREFQEALGIIEAGRRKLAAHPRADMAGFEACLVDQQRLQKSALRESIESANRHALREERRSQGANH